jgi:hypothetical protein
MRQANLGNYPNGNPCGDMRADEPSYDPDHNRLIITNGDGPNGAFLTLMDTTDPMCPPVGVTPAGAQPLGRCVVAQFFYDGLGDNNSTAGCDPTVSGVVTPGPKCRHVGNVPPPSLDRDDATNGLGGSIYNPVTKKFLQAVPQIGNNPEDSEVTEIDPVAVSVTNHFRMTRANGAPGCQPASLALGPNQNLLVGCANREGQAFAPTTVIMDVSAAGKGKIIKVLTEVGRVDQVWYNPGDQRFYLGARDMENGSFLGIVDAVSNMWLYNAPTGGNAHGLAADQFNNHIYVPISPNARCGRYSAQGCIAVYAAQ